MAGVGKTALACTPRTRFVDEFPDGQIFLDLRGHTPGAEPLAPTDALGPAAACRRGRRPRRARRSRGARRGLAQPHRRSAGAARARQRGHGPTGPRPAAGRRTARTLVTSRTRLVGLDGAACRTLGVMAPDEALDLLGRVAGVDVTGAHATPARAIVDACGHLPLAIRLVAARLASRPAWTLASVVERLADERAREGLLGRRRTRRRRGVRRVLRARVADAPPGRSACSPRTRPPTSTCWRRRR